MVQGSMKDNTGKSLRKPRRVIELVGVCGWGKTSLLKELSGRDFRIMRAVPPPKIVRCLCAAREIIRWYPVYCGDRGDDRWFSIHETKLMGCLRTYPSYLSRQACRTDTVRVLDPAQSLGSPSCRISGLALPGAGRIKSTGINCFDYGPPSPCVGQA